MFGEGKGELDLWWCHIVAREGNDARSRSLSNICALVLFSIYFSALVLEQIFVGERRGRCWRRCK